MILMQSGDHHFEIDSPRWGECLLIHHWMVDEARRREIDLFLSGGDIYERLSKPEEREPVAEWLMEMAEVCPVIIAKGNHDRDLDCALLARLKGKHPIIVEERCGVHYVPGVAVVGVVAWPRKEQLAAALPGRPSQEELAQAAQVALRNVLRGLGQEMQQRALGYPSPENDAPKVLLGHFMVNGSKTSSGQPLVGTEMSIGLEDLALAEADITLMSHIHCPQEFALPGGRVALYAGSPRRTAYGETEEKSVVVAEWHRGHLQGWERVRTPCSQMILLEDSWENGEWVAGLHGEPAAELFQGAEVRFRYWVDSDQREDAKSAAKKIEDRCLLMGAVRVKLDETVRPKVRARAPEVTTAKTIGDKLGVLWQSRGETVGDERRARLLARANELNAEVAT